MNNLRKFATEADYSSATLNYPAVSWVVSGDTVHYDKTSGSPTPVVNDKVMFATNGDGSGTSDMVLYNCGSSATGGAFTNITVDDVAVTPITCTTETQYDASQVHIVKYDLGENTTIDDWFTGYLGVASASFAPTIDIFIPASFTSVNNIPSNVSNLVFEATTPPTLNQVDWSGFHGEGIYVPDDSVSAYKSAISGLSNRIFPISQYSGNLPV